MTKSPSLAVRQSQYRTAAQNISDGLRTLFADFSRSEPEVTRMHADSNTIRNQSRHWLM